MKTFIAILAAGALSVGLCGCNGESSGTKSQTTIKGPNGETKITTERTVEKSGKNAPPANPQ
jgi:hypothetical protein